MKKQYIEPFVYIEDVEVHNNILAGSGPKPEPIPPASGIKGYMLENELGLDPTVIGGDYNTTDPLYEPFIEGD